MPFMEAQAEHMKMLHVETTVGTEYIPSEFVPATPTVANLLLYCEGTPETHDSGDVDCERREGWYARFSAPGYLDCTPYIGPYDSAEQALDELAESWDVCRKCWEQCWYTGERCTGEIMPVEPN